MSEVTPNMKPFGACGCGCGKEGTLRVKAYRDGTVCVSRGCPCARCRGKANRSRGDAAGRKVRKALGLVGASTRHEEGWGGPVRTESKAGAQAKPVHTAHRNVKAQSEQSRPIGDSRPFVGAFTVDGRTVLTLDADDLEAVVVAFAQTWGLVA